MLSNIQFAAVMVMSLQTMVLAVLPQRVADQARWLMTASTFLLALQFALQYKLKLHDMGVTQAVMLNLPFFILASILLSAALLYLQRKGHMHYYEWLVGVGVWATTVAMLIIASIIDGQPLLSDTPELRMAETAGGILYALMQGYYAWLTLHELWRMRKAVASYYDRSMSGILNWMERSVWLLALIAILVPLMIFTNGPLLGLFALMTFAAMFYLVVCFLCYIVSSDQKLVEIAKATDANTSTSKKETDSIVQSEDERRASFDRIVSAVEEWTARGGHLQQAQQHREESSLLPGKAHHP